MAIFRQTPWVNPFGKTSIFRLFELPVFIAQKGVLSFQNIVKDIFLTYLPFGKMCIFRLFERPVFIAQKSVLSFQNIVKHIFLTYYPKNKVEKMAILAPKQWDNPFQKMSIFRLFELLVFIAQKGVLSLQNVVKDIFLTYIA